MSKINQNKKSILFLTYDREIDRRTLQQADTMESLGYHVDILAMSHDDKSIVDDPRVTRIINLQDNSPVSYSKIFKIYSYLKTKIPMNGFIMRQLKKIAWLFLLEPEKIYTDIFNDHLNKFNPSMVWAVDLPMLPVAVKAAHMFEANLIYDSHELFSEQEFSSIEKKKWADVERKFIKKCHIVITVNDSIARELENRYDIDKVYTIYNAINKSNEKAYEKVFHNKFGFKDSESVILFQGGISKGRNIDNLVLSMKYVKNNKAKLVILGDGQYRKNLEHIVNSNRLEKKVFFHDKVSQDELLRYTASADYGFIPYQAICRNNYFCTPNKLFEFIASGVPILGTNLPEISSIVNKFNIGKTGITKYPKDIARLIDYAVQDAPKEEWKKNLLEAQEHVSWDHESDKLIEIIKTLEK